MFEGTSMNNLFALEQFSRDSFRVKRTYIDITGDLIAGILLGQIVYWNLPNENGQSKLKVMKNGEMWLAKGRGDWWDEIRITPKQFDRAIKILQEKGFVESKRFKFNGAPTIHIKLNIREVTEAVNSILPKGEIPFYPKGKIDIDEREKSLTEITTKITTEITSDKDNIPYAEIIDYLNQKAGTNYRHTTRKTQTLIKARWNEGFTLEDFKTVIDKKTAEWFHDPKMSKYLRPETLFGNKFEGYLNQKTKVKSDYEYSQYDDLF